MIARLGQHVVDFSSRPILELSRTGAMEPLGHCLDRLLLPAPLAEIDNTTPGNPQQGGHCMALEMSGS